MSLAREYRQQFAWRAWPEILAALPPVRGRTVLDLGCGVGDLAAELVARGARVIGVDANEELLREARARSLANAEFHRADLRALPELDAPADGAWCSFAAAYFPDLAATLAGWTRALAPQGWIALVEIDDFFGHEPLGAGTRARLAAYARDALAAGRYDFHMGRKLRAHVERAGLHVAREWTVEDRELAFAGPADPEVLRAWRARLERMQLLREACGAEFEALREEFLACLSRADHRSTARVVCCLATR